MVNENTVLYDGKKIAFNQGTLVVPDYVTIPYIEGDGIGPDIWRASQQVFDAALKKAYIGNRVIQWLEVFAGEKAFSRTGQWLPPETLNVLKEYVVSIKGPLTTPVGGGIRSINVTIRQVLDLYACIRPVKYFQGVPSPVKQPELMDIVIFRENTEDVYAGIEYKAHSPQAKIIRNVFKQDLGVELRADAGIGIKPISEMASKRLVRQAILYAIEHHKSVVTLVHKGNIMKFTEGAFKDWGYEVANSEFGSYVISEKDVQEKYAGRVPDGKFMINDRIADNMFQQILTRTQDFQVIATTNLNGDYLSDACAAQVGGLGIAPGANIGDYAAVFEATHGTAPKYAGKDMANPGSLILSGVMMLDYIGWFEAARIIEVAFAKTIQQKLVTYDLERGMIGASLLSSSGFSSAIINNL